MIGGIAIVGANNDLAEQLGFLQNAVGGIAGAFWAFIYTGGVEALAFDIDRSFQILFMIIIGGLGSILGSFLGAAFIVLLPIFLDNAPQAPRRVLLLVRPERVTRDKAHPITP